MCLCSTALRPAWAPLRSGIGQATYTCVPLSSGSISWSVKGWWRSEAGKVTVGLVTYWPCITDLVIYPPVCSRPIRGRWSLCLCSHVQVWYRLPLSPVYVLQQCCVRCSGVWSIMSCTYVCDRHTVCGVWRRRYIEGRDVYKPMHRGSRVAVWKHTELAAVFACLLCLCWRCRCPFVTADPLFFLLLSSAYYQLLLTSVLVPSLSKQARLDWNF